MYTVDRFSIYIEVIVRLEIERDGDLTDNADLMF